MKNSNRPKHAVKLLLFLYLTRPGSRFMLYPQLKVKPEGGPMQFNRMRAVSLKGSPVKEIICLRCIRKKGYNDYNQGRNLKILKEFEPWQPIITGLDLEQGTATCQSCDKKEKIRRKPKKENSDART